MLCSRLTKYSKITQNAALIARLPPHDQGVHMNELTKTEWPIRSENSHWKESKQPWTKLFWVEGCVEKNNRAEKEERYCPICKECSLAFVLGLEEEE